MKMKYAEAARKYASKANTKRKVCCPEKSSAILQAGMGYQSLLFHTKRRASPGSFNYTR
jgi:hypothetical protein